ncbi:MAG: hypothetical protein ACE15C_10165 [Phycisphaerae bacterium]
MSEPFIVKCPNCGQSLQAPPERIGTLVSCSFCKTQFTVQAPAAGTAGPQSPLEALQSASQTGYGPPPAPGQPPPYPPYPQYPYQGRYQVPHRGTMILVFGILSWVVCIIFGIIAWVMGNTDLRQMQAGVMDRSGEGLTKAGKILGMVHVIIACCIIPIYIIILIVAMGSSHHGF